MSFLYVDLLNGDKARRWVELSFCTTEYLGYVCIDRIDRGPLDYDHMTV